MVSGMLVWIALTQRTAQLLLFFSSRHFWTLWSWDAKVDVSSFSRVASRCVAARRMPSRCLCVMLLLTSPVMLGAYVALPRLVTRGEMRRASCAPLDSPLVAGSFPCVVATAARAFPCGRVGTTHNADTARKRSDLLPQPVQMQAPGSDTSLAGTAAAALHGSEAVAPRRNRIFCPARTPLRPLRASAEEDDETPDDITKMSLEEIEALPEIGEYQVSDADRPPMIEELMAQDRRFGFKMAALRGDYDAVSPAEDTEESTALAATIMPFPGTVEMKLVVKPAGGDPVPELVDILNGVHGVKVLRHHQTERLNGKFLSLALDCLVESAEARQMAFAALNTDERVAMKF